MAKLETLKSKEEIQSLFKFGKRVTHSPVTFIYRQNGLQDYRFLFCVDRSSKIAVKRNRVKRILRAVVICLNLNKGYDIAIIANYSITKVKFVQRIELFNKFFNQL